MPGFTTKDRVDYNFIWFGVILPTTVEYNEDTTDLQGRLAQTITEEYIRLFQLGGGSYSELSTIEDPDEVSIEIGRLLPLPRFYGLGKGFSWHYLVDANSDDVLEHERQLQFRDRDFMRRQMLAPLFEAPSGNSQKFGMWDGTFKAEEGITAPPPYGVLTFASTHTHYIGTGSPTASGVMLEDLSAMKTHIREHGHMGRIEVWLSESNTNQLELLALPIFDQTRRAGNVGVADTNIQKALDNVLSQAVAQDGYRGDLLGMGVFESAYIPDNWIVAFEVNGARKGMFMQEKSNPIARGLIQFPGNEQYPIQNSRQFRWFKPGVRIRSFAVVAQLGVAAGAYTTPTVYSNVDY